MALSCTAAWVMSSGGVTTSFWELCIARIAPPPSNSTALNARIITDILNVRLIIVPFVSVYLCK